MLYSLSIESAISFGAPRTSLPAPSLQRHLSFQFRFSGNTANEPTTDVPEHESQSVALASRRRCGRTRTTEGRAVSFRINALPPSRINFLPHHSFLASLSFSQPLPSFPLSFLRRTFIARFGRARETNL